MHTQWEDVKFGDSSVNFTICISTTPTIQKPALRTRTFLPCCWYLITACRSCSHRHTPKRRAAITQTLPSFSVPYTIPTLAPPVYNWTNKDECAAIRQPMPLACKGPTIMHSSRHAMLCESQLHPVAILRGLQSRVRRLVGPTSNAVVNTCCVAYNTSRAEPNMRVQLVHTVVTLCCLEPKFACVSCCACRILLSSRQLALAVMFLRDDDVYNEALLRWAYRLLIL